MPPKKKGKKKQKKKVEENEPTLEEKYQRTIQQIDSLQDHLALQTETVRRSRAMSTTLREHVKEAYKHVEEEKYDKHEISSDLIRQYKKMRTDLTNKTTMLQLNLARLKKKLDETETELMQEKEEKLKITKEKDQIIAELEYKIEHMESMYENILHDAFDMMSERLMVTKHAWQDQINDVLGKNKDILLSLGLNPLDI